MTEIAIVVARTRNHVIGRAGGMPWHLPADLAHFKALTLGHPIVMGRKTFASIGRPLPGRTNVVVTRDVSWSAPGVEVASSLTRALEVASITASRVFVIGGGEIYQAALPLASRLFVTQIDAELEGDTIFEFDAHAFRLVRESTRERDDKNAYRLVFQEWERVAYR
jgi:dihydrofolate reductase